MGADPDVDGNGIANGNDSDVDGDGIPNGSDPDIDGDGVPNGQDWDADGDGIPNGSDIDADGDGLTGADDPDGDGSTISDSDNDGDSDGDDAAVDDSPAPDSSCPEGQVCVGDGTCQSGEASTSADCAGTEFISTRVNTFLEKVKASEIFALGESISGIPSGGDPEYTMAAGSTFGGGTVGINLSDLTTVWTVIQSIVLITCAWASIRIITLKR